MSYVFKQLDPSYKTSTPFYAHKKWVVDSTSEVIDISDDISIGEPSMSILYGKFTQSKWILDEDEVMTRNGEFSRNVWNATNQVFYREFQHKPFEYYKYGSVGVETRNISNEIHVFSIPQQIIGEQIHPGSFKLQTGTYTYFDDGNGNILGYPTSNTTAKNIVFASESKDLYFCSFFFYDAFKHVGSRTSYKTRSHGNLGATVEWNLNTGSGISAPVHGPKHLVGHLTNIKGGTGTCPASEFYLDFEYDEFTTGSSYIRAYDPKELNFDTNDSFTISMWINTTNASNGKVTLIAKNGKRRAIRNPKNPIIGPNGIIINSHIVDEITGGAYPFSVELDGSTISFSVSDGVNKPVATGTAGGGWQMVTCRKDKNNLQVIIGSSTAGSPVGCGCIGTTRNDSDLFIGAKGENITSDPLPLSGNAPEAGIGQYNGMLGPIHIFNKYLSDTEISNLYNDYYNNHYGNVLYKQGLVVWTNNHGTAGSSDFKGTTCNFQSMQFRSTKKIITNEFICVSGPGELNMTTNPSILVNSNTQCNPNLGGEVYEGINESGQCYSFVTGSWFSPYVTGVGLYNDAGDLLAVAKLATPIKKPTNCDLVIVVKWDE